MKWDNDLIFASELSCGIRYAAGELSQNNHITRKL